MLRSTIIKSVRPVVNGRLFTTSIRAMAEGDTGAPRSGGAAQADAFVKRERASEEKFIREEEAQRIKQVREKLRQERLHNEELDKSLKELEEREKESGQGENNY